MPNPGADIADSGQRCRNCGTLAPAKYCPECGQETRVALPSIREFVREAAGRLVAIDGRLWRTLGALVFHPGLLTREYLRGRRRTYVRPARLLLASTLLLFAVARIVGSPTMIASDGLIHFDVGEDPPKGAPGASSKATSPETGAAKAAESQPTVERWVAEIEARAERFRKLSPEEKSEQLYAGLFRFGPYATIVLPPIFAFLLRIVYLGRARRYPQRPRRYAEHLVYAAHLHGFLLLLLTAAILIPSDAVRFAIGFWMIVHGLRAARAVYGGPWIGIVLRSFVVGSAYFICGALVMALLVASAALLR